MDLVPLPALVMAGLALGAVLAAPVTAVGRWHRGEPARQVTLSTGLLVFFALQIAAGLLLLDATWPFTGYPMYAMHIPRGAAVEVLLLEGTTRDGQRVDISGASLFADPLDLQARVLPTLRDPAAQPALVERLLQDYNRSRGDPETQLASLRGEVEHRSLADDGRVVRMVEPLFVYPAASQ